MSIFLEIPSFIFSLAIKFSAAFLLFAGLIIVIPDDMASTMAILEFRHKNLTVIWIIFLFSASMVFSSLGKSVWNMAYPAVISKIKKRQSFKKMLERLNSLSERETLWIQCCLYRNQQSMNAPLVAQPPNALMSKGLLVLGRGHVLDATFMIPDELWEYLKSVRSNFIPTEMTQRQKNEFESNLKDYQRSLHPY